MSDEALDPELERAIHEDPDDDARFRVYADWMIAHGNPRGELAAVQLERERMGTPELAARELELLERHADQIRGPRITRSRAQLRLDELGVARYRGGFWRGLSIDDTLETLSMLLAHPSARLLHTLEIAWVEDPQLQASTDFDAAVEALLGAGHSLAGLRELRIGRAPEHQDEHAEFPERSCSRLNQLAAVCPRLEVIRLWCPNFAMGEFPELRWLDARTGISAASIAAIAATRLPKLERLDLTEDEWCGLTWPDDALDQLLEGRATPRLRHLSLVSEAAEFEPRLREKITASPLGRRLELLEFDGGWSCDEGEADGFFEI